MKLFAQTLDDFVVGRLTGFFSNTSNQSAYHSEDPKLTCRIYFNSFLISIQLQTFYLQCEDILIKTIFVLRLFALCENAIERFQVAENFQFHGNRPTIEEEGLQRRRRQRSRGIRSSVRIIRSTRILARFYFMN